MKIKKKLKDMTIGELIAHCEITRCWDCPLYACECPTIRDLYSAGDMEFEFNEGLTEK